ncbi:MAG: hypothetical protein HRT74_01815 [Flavobacteriales bacterium]|nr:hypothetical protein [Flavobacteriales bacterium]
MRKSILVFLLLASSLSLLANDCDNLEWANYNQPFEVNMGNASASNIDPFNDESQWVSYWFQVPTNPGHNGLTMSWDFGFEYFTHFSVHSDCSDESIGQSCYENPDGISCSIDLQEFLDNNQNTLYIRVSQVQGQTDEPFQLNIRPEIIGCTDGCSSS